MCLYDLTDEFFFSQSILFSTVTRREKEFVEQTSMHKHIVEHCSLLSIITSIEEINGVLFSVNCFSIQFNKKT